MGKFIESYELVKTFKRVVELDNGDVVTTRLKVYQDESSKEYFPSWEHSVQHYEDTHSYPSVDAAVKYWENKIVFAKSAAEFALTNSW